MDNRIILALAAVAGIAGLYFLSKRPKANGIDYSVGDFETPEAPSPGISPMTLLKVATIQGKKPAGIQNLISQGMIRPIRPMRS